MSADITTLDVAIAGGRTRLDSLGTPTDPTIVYLHSALLDGRMWHATMHAFASLPGRPVRQIAYDMRGHGAAAQSGELRDVTQLAEDLTSLLDNLSLDAVHIVGVSMGGAVAQQFAARAPQRVHSLTLIATSADFPSLPLMDRAAAYRTRGQDDVAQETLERWLSGTGPGSETALSYVRRLLETVDQAHWEDTWRALAGYQVPESSIRTLDVPVLGIAGGRDTSTPPQIMHRMCGLYRRAEYLELPDASHMVPLEYPQQTAEAIHGLVGL